MKRYVSLLLIFLVVVTGLCHERASWARSSSQQGRTIRVVMDNNYPPYVFLDGKGGLQGILIDQWRLWEQKTGIRAEIHAMDWGEALKRMEAGEFDVIDTIFFNERRGRIYDFAKPYAKIEVSIFFDREISGITDADSLQGFPVAVKSGDAAIDYLKGKGVGLLQEYPSYEAIIEAAKAHKVIVAVVDKPPALYFLHKLGIQQLFRHSAPLYTGEFHRAVRRGHTAVLKSVEEGFAAIPDSEYQAINRKWFGTETYQVQPYFRHIAAGLGTAILILLVLVIWNRTLRRKVRERTLRLEEEIALNLAKTEAVRKSEEKYRDLVENANSIILRMDKEGRVTFFNEFAQQFFGFSEAEITGRSVVGTIVPKTDSSGLDLGATIADIGRNPEAYASHENENVRSNGERVWISWTNKPILDRNGEVSEILCIGNDITDRRRMEKDLREKTEELDRYFTSSLDLLCIADMEGYFRRLNPEWEATLGYPLKELEGSRFLDLVHPDDLNVTLQAVSRLGAQEQILNFTNRYRCRDGSYRWIEWRSIPRGHLIYAAARDITERKQAEEERERLRAQLTQAQKMESIGRLAGGVAHDFNNMLGVIIGHAELAMERVDEGAPLFANLQEIRKAAGRSSDLTRQLLAFARKQIVTPRVLDLNDTVEGMLRMLRRLIGEDIDLAWLPGKNIGPVRMDPSQIDQILANLCVNARDAIGGTGRVTIETGTISFDQAFCAEREGAVPGDYVLLSVSDNGCGMDPETLSRLFEPFFTTKEIGKGTGLGLATVYGIVRQNNGFIDVSSEAGKGTVFRIYLPRHEGRAEQSGDERPESREGFGHETILLVEDEPAILNMTTMMLRSQGYTVLASTTPGEAIDLAREHPGEIHLLMTDVVMPGMNGRDLAKRLLSLYPNLKRLFMSGYTANVIAHHGVLDEGVNFIQKPFTVKDLIAKIRDLLDRH